MIVASSIRAIVAFSPPRMRSEFAKCRIRILMCDAREICTQAQISGEARRDILFPSVDLESVRPRAETERRIPRTFPAGRKKTQAIVAVPIIGVKSSGLLLADKQGVGHVALGLFRRGYRSAGCEWPAFVPPGDKPRACGLARRLYANVLNDERLCNRVTRFSGSEPTRPR